MKNTVNMVKKIAAIAAATAMAMSVLGATVSAQTITEGTFNGVVTVVSRDTSDTVVYADCDSVTVSRGDTASVLLTVHGSKNISVISTDDKVATAQLCNDGFYGDSILLNVKGVDGGTAKIRIMNRNTGDFVKTISVNVNTAGAAAGGYSSAYSVYSFRTDSYYRTYEEAFFASDNFANCIYCGKIDAAMNADANHRFFSTNTNRYYSTYDMALAASDGLDCDVIKVQVYVSNESTVYTNEYRYFCFTTGLYYSTWDAAYAAAGYDSTVIFCGRVDSSCAASFGYEYYSSFDGFYYTTYEMALAASHGQAAFVSVAADQYIW